MRNFLIVTVFIFLLGNLCRFGLPWWAVMPLGTVAGFLFQQSALRSLLAGLLGGFLLWALTAALLDQANSGLLSARVGDLFGGLGRLGMLVVTGLVGGLLAAMGVLVGSYARQLSNRT